MQYDSLVLVNHAGEKRIQAIANRNGNGLIAGRHLDTRDALAALTVPAIGYSTGTSPPTRSRETEPAPVRYTPVEVQGEQHQWSSMRSSR